MSKSKTLNNKQRNYENYIINCIKKLEEIREYENYEYEDVSLLVNFSYRDEEVSF